MNMKRLLTIALSFVMIISLASCASSNQPSETPPAAESAVPQSEAHSQVQTPQTEDVTLEFLQWWEPELPGSEFRDILDQFEAENPGIKVELISGPYTNIKQQVVIGAASGTLSDVVGMDGVWINDISKQGAVANLTELMETMGYDDSKIADQT